MTAVCASDLIALGGLALLAEGAAWREETRALYVADAHLRKATAFRAHGRHHPISVEEAYAPGRLTLAGHLHPTMGLYGPGRDRLRRPCFLRRGRQTVPPSFGEFTGGDDINRETSCEVFAICGDKVRRVR